MGSITETATSAPGNSSLRPNTKAPLAMTLKLNGYSTAQFGKCHEVPVWQSSPMGPFDAWPSGGGGFETFYGFIGGENNQWDPALYDGTTPVEPPATPEEGYHLTEDLADRAVQLGPSAEGADAGQAVLRVLRARRDPRAAPRAEGVGRQVRGAVRRRVGRAARAHVRAPEGARGHPGRRRADARGTTRSRPGTTCPTSSSRCSARQMEVYAGFLEHTDHHVGRVIDAIDDLGVLDDTIIYYIIGDNGASAEGTLNGAFNEMANFNGMAALETPEFMLSKMDEFGSPTSYNHYAVGWAWAMDTPVPVDQAGRLALGRHPQRHDRALAERHRRAGRPAFAVHPRDRRRADDPRGGRSARADHGERRAAVAHGGHQHAVHVQRAGRTGAPRPAVLRDVRQPRHLPQGLERGHEAPHALGHGRRQSSRRSTTTSGSCTTAPTDYSQARNLVAEQPGDAGQAATALAHRGDEVQRAAHRRPQRRAARPRAWPADRPSIHGNSQLFFPGMGRLSENSVVSIKNKSFSVTAEIEVPDGGADGVIIAQGGRFGGWALYAKDGKAKFVYNVLGIQEFATEADAPIPAGTHQVRMEFAYDGGGLAKGGDVTLYYDGDAVGTGRVEATQAMIFSADETTDIGYESGTTVTPDYTATTSRFTGQDPLGPDRPRRRRPRPLHRPRRAPPHRHGPAVAAVMRSPVTDESDRVRLPETADVTRHVQVAAERAPAWRREETRC